jgi:c-di-GMP-related signal transduction protein
MARTNSFSRHEKPPPQGAITAKREVDLVSWIGASQEEGRMTMSSPSPTGNTNASPAEMFVAREPIFDRRQKVYAYELLFRSGLDNVFNYPDPDEATSRVIASSFLLCGIDAITGGKRGFINVTRNVLLKEQITLLPKESFVVEILETVQADAAIIAACQKLKQAGYLLALDDFTCEALDTPLVELADIIKVDFLANDKAQRQDLLRHFASRRIRLLAEKVETREALQEAMDTGYTYFQGYFFGRPLIMAGKDMPAFKLHLLQLLAEISRSDLDFARLADIIEREMSLSYKLLRYINSVFFRRRCQINSIKHALALLGEIEVKKLLSLIGLASLGRDKPEELAILAVIRAKFCESLAPHAGVPQRAQDLFLMGLFSLLDAIVDQPLADILSGMPLADDIKAALLGEDGRLHDVYQYTLAYEKGDWEKVSAHAARLALNETEIPLLYRQALEWCRQSFHGSVLAA